MLALNERTLELYDQLVSDGVEFEMHNDGLLFLFLDERGAEEEAAVLEDLRRHGYPGDVRRLTVAEAQELDPAVGEQVKGVFLAAAERHVRPESLTCRSRLGAPEQRCRAARRHRGDGDRGRIRRMAAPGGTTSRSPPTVWFWPPARGRAVSSPRSVKIRQEAAKGYSLTTRGEGTRPRHALYLGEAKVGCSPFEDGVRLAGTLELAGIDLSPNRARLEAVARSATRYLRTGARWRPSWNGPGLRPLPPDGLPHRAGSRTPRAVRRDRARDDGRHARAVDRCRTRAAHPRRSARARARPFRIDR